jgi:hypothetical protein
VVPIGALRCSKCNAALATPIKSGVVKDLETAKKVLKKMRAKGVLVVKVTKLTKKGLLGKSTKYKIYYRK